MRVRTSAKREEILEISRDIFLAQGYSGTSMASIAARVGGSKATLYGYFKSKEELFGAVVQAVSVERIVPVLDELELGSPDFETTIDRVALALVRFFVDPQAVASYRLAIAESARFPELGRAFYENGRKAGQQRVATWFQQQMTVGRLKKGDAEIAAEQFTALCEIGPGRQMLLGFDLQPGETEVSRLARQAVSTFLAAYRPEASEPINADHSK